MPSVANDRRAGQMLNRRQPSISRLLACCLAAVMILVFAQAAQARRQPAAAPPAPTGPAGPVGQTASDLPNPVVLAPDGSREASPLVLGDDIALGLRHSAPDSRDRHDGWSYRVFVTNLAWDAAGNLSPTARSGSGGRELLLKRDSPLVLFNLVAVVEWDATTEYLTDLDEAFRHASDYLFDLTDGQMALGQVTIVDNAREGGNPTSDRDAWWKSADIRFGPDNTIDPKHIPPSASATRYGIDLGPFWSRKGVAGNWSGPDGHRTLIHELGHYALGLYDEYGTNEFCTHERSVPPDSAGDDARASAMSWQFDATELSACPPQQPNCTAADWSVHWPLWSEACARTTHYRTTRQSAWAVIDQRYSDPATDPRWQIVSPTERGRVMAEPTVVPAVFPWPQIHVHSYIDPMCDHDEAACLPVREVCIDNAQATCGGAKSSVGLRRPGEEDDRIEIGQLNEAGCISILEAKPGSELMITCFNQNNYVATVVIEESMPARVSATYPETALASPGAPSTAFAAALLTQDAAVLNWTARYWENVQVVTQNHPDLARQLFGPPSELTADSGTLIALLEQQVWSQAGWQGAAGPHLPAAGDVAFDTHWPAAGSLWWQQIPLLDDPANAQQRSLQQALPLVAQAYRRQANLAVQTINADSGGFLITPDGVWTAEAPRQPATVDVALESISAVPGQQTAGDIATGFSLTASGSLVGPIMVRYTTNCGPGGGATDLALVNILTNVQIDPTFIESCFPVEFAIDEAGTYRLISTAQR